MAADPDDPMPEKPAMPDPRSNGLEIGAPLYSINDKMLGAGEPLRVRPGERVLMHLLTASAAEIHRVGLFGHHFQVIALDGNPAPGNHEFYDEHGETGVAGYGYGYFSYFNGFQIDTKADANLGKPQMTTIPDPCPANPACGPGATPSTDLSPQPIPRADGQAGHFELGANGGQNGTGVGDGWYSYNVGSWHLVSLNIECSTQPGGCSTTGAWFAAELAWLQKDLDENHAACTLAYWHQPTFSPTNGISPEGIAAQAFWRLLYEHKADLVLNGHDHLYARYRPLDPAGNPDPRQGITEFVIGTGGETLDPVVATTVTSGSSETNMENPGGNTNFNAQNLVAATGDYWGVMALTLDQNGYAWNFQSALQGPVNNGQFPALAPTGSYTDTGSGTCHGPVYR